MIGVYSGIFGKKDLDPRQLPEEKVIKTLIYSVKSSGNQAERGPQENARLSAEEYPKVNQIVQNDIYVDDFLSGEENVGKSLKGAGELELGLNRVGFTLKGITFTEVHPSSSLLTDDSNVNVARIK